MSNPQPTPVRPVDRTLIWNAIGVAVLSLLSGLFGAWLVPELPKTPPSPDRVVVPVAVPESWIVLDKDGVRVTDPTVEKIAGSLKAGRWTAQGIPRPGEKGVSLTIVVSDGTTPVPPVVVPPVVVPPVDPPPVVVDPPEPPPVTVKATAATYVYEKDSGGVPSHVLTGLNRLNREKKIVATLYEDDTPDGSGEVPEQYKVPLKAAQDAGLPALVVTAGNVVLKVVKAPKTEAELMEAVQ